MEGNECYKFSTIRNYVALTGAPPVRVVMDVGANVGAVTRLAKWYFPEAHVHAYEAVAEYAQQALANTRDLDCVRVQQLAITAAHRFRDDAGRSRRRKPAALRVLKGLPASGIGWVGGSMILPEDDPSVEAGGAHGYELLADAVPAATFDETVEDVLRVEGADEVDLVKMDCEGCEHSCLGSAARATLERCRFVVGEYHGIQRFHAVIRGNLLATHRVNLIGGADFGAFFAERRGAADSILREQTAGLAARPWLGEGLLDWHLFDERFVLEEDRPVHALP